MTIHQNNIKYYDQNGTLIGVGYVFEQTTDGAKEDIDEYKRQNNFAISKIKTCADKKDTKTHDCSCHNKCGSHDAQNKFMTTGNSTFSYVGKCGILTAIEYLHKGYFITCNNFQTYIWMQENTAIDVLPQFKQCARRAIIPKIFLIKDNTKKVNDVEIVEITTLIGEEAMHGYPERWDIWSLK